MSDFFAMDSRAALPRNSILPWLVCLSAGLFFFYEFFQLNIFDAINTSLRSEFHLTSTELSWLSSSYLWADIIFLIPAGLILDRFSTRFVVLIAMLLCIIGTFGFAVSHSFLMAFFFHFLSGIGNAFCFLSCVVLATNWFLPNRQALVIGLLVTMAFIGGMVAHTPFAFLIESYGWRQALMIDALIGIVLWFWIYFNIKDKPITNSNHLQPAHALGNSSFINALGNKQNWLVGLYTSLLNFPIMILCALWGTNYLQVAHGLSDIAASAIVNCLFLGSIIGCPLMGWLSDRQGQRKPLMIVGALASLLTVLPFFMSRPLSATELTTLFFALGFFTSTQVISYPMVTESNPLVHNGASTAIASVIIMGGGGIGQVLFGWLMQLHASTPSSYSVSDFKFAMGIFPLTIVISLLAVLLTRETYCKRQEHYGDD